MKVVVFGCQQIAVDVISHLYNMEEIELPLVVTYELPLDKTYGYESVMEFCRDTSIDVINPRSVTEDVVRQVKDCVPELILSVYYRKILPQSLIELPRLGCINIHPGALPYYRGPVPTAWAIANGEEEFGITIHYMDKSIDTGEILVQEMYEIGENETGYELYTRAMGLGGKLLEENIYDILNQKLKHTPQCGPGSYYGKWAGKLTIDWRRSAKDIRNMIRVHAKPFNPAETLLFNRYVLINRAVEYDMGDYPLQGGGRIVKIIDNDQLVVSCADGFLLLEDYEIAPALSDNEREIYMREGNRFG